MLVDVMPVHLVTYVLQRQRSQLLVRWARTLLAILLHVRSVQLDPLVRRRLRPRHLAAEALTAPLARLPAQLVQQVRHVQRLTQQIK